VFCFCSFLGREKQRKNEEKNLGRLSPIPVVQITAIAKASRNFAD
jgi:hypothetical protein